MLQNYLKIAYRHLLRKKLFSFINIIGLSSGMAVAILISLWIWDEVSFDKYHDNYYQIAKVRQNVKVNGNIETLKTVPLPLSEVLRSEYSSDFRHIVTSSHRSNHVLTYGGKQLFAKGVFFSPEGPDMLSLKMTNGNKDGLKEWNSILLSAHTATSYFGNEDPVNKLMTIDNTLQVKVAGVYEDLPENTTFGDLAFIAPFDLYLNTEHWITDMKEPWSRNPVQLYVQLADGVNLEQAETHISNIIRNHAVNDVAGKNAEVVLDPMAKWHLYTYQDGKNDTGSVRYIKLFALIGVFVLLLACINFMNLSTARSEKRAKEVGIRKAVGSLRSQLISQFFCEAVLTTLVSFIFSLVFVQLSLYFFNSVSGKHLSILWDNSYFWLTGILFSLITGLIAGSYPAFYLSSFHPAKVLKGSFRMGRFAAVPRKALVVIQFIGSVTLIICTIVVFRQVQFAKDRPSGYDRNNLLLVPMNAGEIPLHFEAVKAELIKAGAITQMARSESTTTDIWGTDQNLNWKGKDPRSIVDFPNTGVSVDYGKTVGWTFSQGRDFSPYFPSDSSAFILNEAAVKYMGLEKPVGERIQWNDQPFTVIGVIKDMIVESPYEPVRPSIYCLARGHDNFSIAKLNTAMSTNKAIAKIEQIFKKYSPATPFDYSFVSEEYDTKFNSEERIAKLAGFFSVLAIFISCLGLFGMASFMIGQRMKEIGVRKVLGASAFSIWRLLSNEFVRVVIYSLLISIPLANYLMYTWLQNYPYRTNLSWWIFALVAAGALLITLITVSFEAIKAGLANPINSLQSE